MKRNHGHGRRSPPAARHGLETRDPTVLHRVTEYDPESLPRQRKGGTTNGAGLGRGRRRAGIHRNEHTDGVHVGHPQVSPALSARFGSGMVAKGIAAPEVPA